jgi:hypothetical protein
MVQTRRAARVTRVDSGETMMDKRASLPTAFRNLKGIVQS